MNPPPPGPATKTRQPFRRWLGRTGWLLPPLFFAGVWSPWERWCPEGLASPESLWESRSRAGASAPKLSSFFPGTKPRCEQDKLEGRSFLPVEPRKRPARSPKVPGGFAGASRGLGGAEMQSPAAASQQSLPCWLSMYGGGRGTDGDGHRTKIALIKLRVWKLFLRLGSGQPFCCAGLGCSQESQAHAFQWVFGFCSFRQ